MKTASSPAADRASVRPSRIGCRSDGYHVATVDLVASDEKFAHTADVTDRAAVDAALNAVREQLGPVTIRPQPASTMSGSTACTQWNTPLRLTSMTWCQSSNVRSVNRLKRSMPAAFTRIVTAPSCSRTACQRGVHRGAVGDVGGVGELVVGRDEVEGGDVVSVGAQPIRDGLADARAASGDDGGLHAAAPVSIIKNLPFEYENRTLASVQSRKTNQARLSHPICCLNAVIRAHD